MDEFHIGAEIRKMAKARRIGATQIARQLGKTRGNVNNIFKRKAIDSDLLCQLSVILNFDFFELYSRILKSKIELEKGMSHEMGDRNALEVIIAHERNSSVQGKYIAMLEDKIEQLQQQTRKKEKALSR
jgi:transcriptional regulator with XRE-family HTH domain